MAIHIYPSVESTVQRLSDLLQRARQVKVENDIVPPLSVSDLSDDGQPLLSDAHTKTPYAIAETAARDVFHNLLTLASIGESQFVGMWNLLDILQFCGDADECDPALALWLIEELLDSQSIDGCRRVFEYLESRREKLIAKNFMKNKNLVVLRMCNELLRRLSRAEDAVFCGRVFIFLFQSFPLGDKSSVNLRGEFHVENVTSYEESNQATDMVKDMDVDVSETQANGIEAIGSSDTAKESSEAPNKDHNDVKTEDEQQILDSEGLYPVFWRLQKAFSNPTILFTQEHLIDFQHGLEETIRKFKKVPRVQQSRKTELNRGVKRKHNGPTEDAGSNVNPKYLTSKDLFKLELSDLDFQRYFLVQALILIDFLLSLTDSARTKLAHINTQKSLQYQFTLSEEDTNWALATRDKIHDYVRSGGSEEEKGRFFIRMVDTILQRDQNWVQWKMESCPPIAREPIPSSDFLETRASTQRTCMPRRMRANPMSAVDLKFLSETRSDEDVDLLKVSSRYTIPDEKRLIESLETDELDLDFAAGEAKEKLEESMASKTWKTLRIAAKTKLIKFDKIDDKKNLKGFLATDAPRDASKEEANTTAEEQGDEPVGEPEDEVKQESIET